MKNNFKFLDCKIFMLKIFTLLALLKAQNSFNKELNNSRILNTSRKKIYEFIISFEI
jgi:hypothetical protein